MHRRGLKIIRIAALGLIALPEPITTGLGVAALAGATYLSRKQDEEVLNRFAQALRGHYVRMRSLRRELPLKESRYANPAPCPAPRPSCVSAIPESFTQSELRTIKAPALYPKNFQPYQEVRYHTIDMPRLRARFAKELGL